MTVYGKTGHNAACVISRKDRSISLKCIVSSLRKGTVRSIIAGTTKATMVKLGELNIWTPTTP